MYSIVLFYLWSMMKRELSLIIPIVTFAREWIMGTDGCRIMEGPGLSLWCGNNASETLKNMKKDFITEANLHLW